MRWRVVLVLVLLLGVGVVVGLSAWGRSERETMEGRISIKGSEPHTYVALSTPDQTYQLTGDPVEVLAADYQNQTVRVEGVRVEGDTGSLLPLIEVESFEVVER
ncbi:MAG: hypothetical protein ACOCU4_09755 [Alkalispirochaeta sp.]